MSDLFFHPFDDTTWPYPGSGMADIEWRLRYGGVTEKDRMYAASVLAAYRELMVTTAKRREVVVRRYREKRDAGSIRRR